VLNIEEVGLDAADTELDLEGLGGLEVLQLDNLDAGGNDLTVVGGPETLTIEGAGEEGIRNLDFDGGLLTVEDTVTLTLESAGEVDAELAGADLVDVTVIGGNAY